jgi:hypothetical protein
MRIEYRANGQQREVRDSVGDELIARRIARPAYQTRDLRAVETVDELSALKAEADRRGIKYHHRAGVAKLRELLEG